MGRIKTTARKLAPQPIPGKGIKRKHTPVSSIGEREKSLDPDTLSSAAADLWNRYHELGNLEDLQEAINIDRQVFKIYAKANSKEFFAGAGNLGVGLLDLFTRTGQQNDLTEALHLLQQAALSMPPDNPAYPRAKVNLGNAYRAKFELLGEAIDLDNAIDLYDEAAQITPPDYPLMDVEHRQSGLARCLLMRGFPQDIPRAMSLLAVKPMSKIMKKSSDEPLPPLTTYPKIGPNFREYREFDLPVRNLTGSVVKVAEFACGFGYFADVFLGDWRDGRRSNKKKVAIKVLRRNQMDVDDDPSLQRIHKRLLSEIRVWSTLDHSNVVKMHGICDGFGPYMSIICPWYSNGTISNFLQKYKSIIYEERLRLIREVSCGLAYLHSKGIIHGDLTGPNILVDDDHHACLSDFGLSVLAKELDFPTMPQSSAVGGAVRWAAPELFSFDGIGTALTQWCDIYSFGSVALEIFTGSIPYADVEYDIEVLLKYVVAGVRPRRPRNKPIHDIHWSAIHQCWSNEPIKRPRTTALASLFQELE
ncbi:kinase-like protein [Rickenella mellea]|uniref:Kinase-like protein n=1 Tax=Rickenella mellea TaxID=50990 RepID=A0A4R5XDX4_9AGAM|nr:kinase-like protein [Rickenella mellea]